MAQPQRLGAPMPGQPGYGGQQFGQPQQYQQPMQQIQIAVPNGYGPRQTVQVRTQYGQMLVVQIPDNCYPGMVFMISVPIPPQAQQKFQNSTSDNSFSIVTK